MHRASSWDAGQRHAAPRLCADPPLPRLAGLAVVMPGTTPPGAWPGRAPTPNPGAATDTLVSLEVAVGRVIPVVTDGKDPLTGIVPAVVARFLDFPVLSLSVLSPDAAAELAGVAQAGPTGTDSTAGVARQLRRLRGLDGAFHVNKGKSCLFRMPVGLLQQRLQDVPLYVSHLIQPCWCCACVLLACTGLSAAMLFELRWCRQCAQSVCCIEHPSRPNCISIIASP